MTSCPNVIKPRSFSPHPVSPLNYPWSETKESAILGPSFPSSKVGFPRTQRDSGHQCFEFLISRGSIRDFVDLFIATRPMFLPSPYKYYHRIVSVPIFLFVGDLEEERYVHFSRIRIPQRIRLIFAVQVRHYPSVMRSGGQQFLTYCGLAARLVANLPRIFLYD